MPPLVKWSRRAGILIAMPVGRIDGTNYLECQNILESGIDPDENAMILDFGQLGLPQQRRTSSLPGHRQEVHRTGKVLRYLQPVQIDPRHRHGERL